jgi:hypothetical protein
MENMAVFNIDEVIPMYDGTIVAVLSLVDVEDDDESPPIVAARCPHCWAMVGDFADHWCN